MQGISATVAFGIVLTSDNGNNILIVKYDLSSSNSGAFPYSGLQSTYAKAGFSLNAATINNGYVYFTGGLRDYIGNYNSAWNHNLGYVSRMSLTENVAYTLETCRPYTLSFSSSNEKQDDDDYSVSVITNLYFI